MMVEASTAPERRRPLPSIEIGPHDHWYSLHWPRGVKGPEGFVSGDALPVGTLERKLEQWGREARQGEGPGLMAVRRVCERSVLHASEKRPDRYRVSGNERMNWEDFGFLPSCGHAKGARFRAPLFFVCERNTQPDRFPVYVWESGVCLR